MTENPGNLTYVQDPPASSGMMLAALGGPHNAARAATAALDFLMEQAGSVRFAHADPDDFYVYGPSIPAVRVEAATGTVQVSWPGLEFRGAPPGSPPAPVFMSGARPQLRLLEFTRMVGEVARRCGVQTVLDLTSAPGGRAHTRPVAIAATVIAKDGDPDAAKAVERISYDPRAEPLVDPALIHACLSHGLNYAAVCGFAPEYLNLYPNRLVALELLRSVRSFTGMDLDLEEAERKAEEFRLLMERAVGANPMLGEIARIAERAEDAARPEIGSLEIGEMNGEIERFPPVGAGEGRGRPGLRAAESDAARPFPLCNSAGPGFRQNAPGWPQDGRRRPFLLSNVPERENPENGSWGPSERFSAARSGRAK